MRYTAEERGEELFKHKPHPFLTPKNDDFGAAGAYTFKNDRPIIFQYIVSP